MPCSEIMKWKVLPCRFTLELPEDIVQELRSRWKDLPRAALSLALEAY
jgi:cation transport regulator ChaB